MTNQEIIFALAGQKFYFDPPEGRPSAADVKVYPALNDDESGTVAATSSSATVDTVDTTLGTDASIGDTELTVTDATGIARGRRYLLSENDREWVEVLFVSGTTVKIRQPLKNAYTTSAALQGCRISIAVDSTWVNNKSNITDILDPSNRLWMVGQSADVTWVPGAAGYRLKWSYTVDGEATQAVSFADLVRYQAKNLVTPLDVDARFPGWLDRLPTDYQEDQGASFIGEAFRALKMDCLGDEQVIRRIRNTEVLRELTIYRANVLAQEASLFNGGTNADLVTAARASYQARYDQLMREPKVPVDQTGQGASQVPLRAPAWGR